MIAPVRTKQPQSLEQQHHEQFLEMLPQIRSQARLAFRRLRSEYKADLIQEVVANSFCCFVRLVRRGKASLAYAKPLADFAIRQVNAGRRVGCKINSLDVTSRHAREVRGVRVERLDRYDEEQGEWRAALIEDRRATPADIAAARIDVAAWFRSLPLRHHRIAVLLAMGETTSEVARRFDVSLGRISQLREVLRASWEAFHERNHLVGQTSPRS